MLPVLAACAILQAESTSVADFFPLVPGTKWTYLEDNTIFTDRVGEPVMVGERLAYPVTSTFSGDNQSSKLYYRIEGNTVLLVAHDDPKKPLPTPTPVLKFDPGRQTKWDFTGFAYALGGPAEMKMTGESVLKGKQNILGEDVEVIEVKLHGELSVGTPVKVNQVAYYAKGIGLIEMLSDNSIGSKKSKSQLKLTGFEKAKVD